MEYIEECVRLASERFSIMGVKVYPMNTDEYALLHSRGTDYVTVFQETYDPARYVELYLSGLKRVFSYRFDTQERAFRGRMRGVAFGILLDLGDDFRKDALACGFHAISLHCARLHAEISISLPRLRFAESVRNKPTVTESQLLQVFFLYRIFLPYAGQTIFTKKRPGFRDNIVGLSATKISAEVIMSIDKHSGEAHEDGRFEISDPSGLAEITDALRRKGLRPIMTDYMRT